MNEFYYIKLIRQYREINGFTEKITIQRPARWLSSTAQEKILITTRSINNIDIIMHIDHCINACNGCFEFRMLGDAFGVYVIALKYDTFSPRVIYLYKKYLQKDLVIETQCESLYSYFVVDGLDISCSSSKGNLPLAVGDLHKFLSSRCYHYDLCVARRVFDVIGIRYKSSS